MKKTLILLSSLLVLFSCAKESAIADREAAGENSSSVPGQSLTIHASIPEGGLTKVSMEQDALNPDGAIKLAWEAEDVLTVTDASEPANSVTFTLQSGAGEKDATFTGTTPSGWTAPFNVSYSSAGKGYNYSVQTQAADGSTAHLKYVATLSGVTDLEHFAFSKAWADANSATLSSSSVLRIRVQMPDGVAAKVKCMKLKTPAAPGDEMVLNLTTPSDADGDGILNLYLTIPAGDIALPEGTPVALVFDTEDSDSFVRIHKFTAESSILSGRVNTLKFNCKSLVNSGCECIVPGDGSSAYPYLVGDKYQLQTLQLLLGSETTFVKLVDDIDMDGETWTYLNSSEPYQPIDFDGNNKTISKLSAPLFYVLNGSVKDLTLDQSNITRRGILTDYIQKSGNIVSNVNVTNGTVKSTSANVGGLIGYINKGTSADAVTATITGCSVSDTDVAGAGVVGGMIGFADAKIDVSGCKVIGGSVTTSARYAGGFLGSTGDYNSTIADCSVEGTSVNAAVSNNDFRTGGFIGQQQFKVTVKGCAAGTASAPVNLTLAAPTSGKVYNAGGFVGVAYGTITKNGDTRCSSIVNITAGNETENGQLNLGGFVGYNQGTTEYSDATIIAEAVNGATIGGFAGIIVNGSIENCTAGGAVSGSYKAGGFVGTAQNGSINECSASTIVSKVGSGSDFGGFAGEVTQTVTLTKCHASGNISINANYVAGFAGTVNTASGKTATISKCWSTGVVTSSSAQCGGFIGHIAAKADGTVVVSDCYSTGNLVETNQRQGGLVGQINSGKVTISRCYSSGTVSGSFAVGGLVGYLNTACTVEKCVAWNSAVTAGKTEPGNWSTGAVLGVTFPAGCVLTDNYRNPAMSITSWWIPDSDYQHPNVDATHPLIVKDKTSGELRDAVATDLSNTDNYPQYAYHGKVDAGKTLSQLASTTLGWSADVWDFGEDLPKLK